MSKSAPKINTELYSIEDLRPYEYNPRDNSAAVGAVKESIQNFGFLVPIVVDADNIIVAGHTRYAAALELNLSEVPVIKATHLDEAQIKAFRLIDNKTSELARWDFDLLAPEIAFLNDSGIVMTEFGWTQEEIDCLTHVVAEDCLDAPEHDETEGDGINSAKDTNKGGSVVSRDPTSVRVAIGEINFFVDIEFYREWAHKIREANDFDMEKIVADLAGRLELEYRPFASKKDAKELGKPKDATQVKKEARAREKTEAVAKKPATKKAPAKKPRARSRAKANA
jgi:hypothetical protein